MPTAEEDEDARTSRTLISYATSTTDDLYGLLSLPAPTSTSEPPTAAQLKKAWRAVALQWHPDKNRGNEAEAATRLDAARKALDVLSDAAARQGYDERQRAKREKVEREGKFEEKRRRMKQDLERRESGGWSASAGGSPGGFGKRKVGAEETEAERREREVRRLAADGARRRAEKEEQLRKEREEEIEARLAGKTKKRKTGDFGEPLGSPDTPSRTPHGTNPSTPSFSFKKSGGNGTAGGTPGSGTPSLFEATMARLRAKEAEKRRLEEEIRREDEDGPVAETVDSAA